MVHCWHELREYGYSCLYTYICPENGNLDVLDRYKLLVLSSHGKYFPGSVEQFGALKI